MLSTYRITLKGLEFDLVCDGPFEAFFTPSFSKKFTPSVSRSLGGRPKIHVTMNPPPLAKEKFRAGGRTPQIKACGKEIWVFYRDFCFTSNFLNRTACLYWSRATPTTCEAAFCKLINHFLVINGSHFSSMLLHASAVIKDGLAWVFLAPSGGGKSTAAKLLRDLGFELLADDLILVTKRNSYYFIYDFLDFYGEPDAQKINRHGQLEQMFFLGKKGTIPARLEDISLNQALKKLARQLDFPYKILGNTDIRLSRTDLDFFLELLKQVPHKLLSYSLSSPQALEEVPNSLMRGPRLNSSQFSQ